MIIEQVDCAADTGNNAVRRSRVKCCAAGCGLALLLLVLLLEHWLGAPTPVDNAVATTQSFAGDAHE